MKEIGTESSFIVTCAINHVRKQGLANDFRLAFLKLTASTRHFQTLLIHFIISNFLLLETSVPAILLVLLNNKDPISTIPLKQPHLLAQTTLLGKAAQTAQTLAIRLQLPQIIPAASILQNHALDMVSRYRHSLGDKVADL